MSCQAPFRTCVPCLLALLMPASADGGLFFLSVADPGRSSDQRAIVIVAGGRETLIVETRVENAQSGFAWVLPTPGVVEAGTVTEVDPAVFQQLDERTAPTIEIYTGGGGGNFVGPPGCGCAASAGDGAAGGGGTDTVNPVTVWETVRVGAYDLTTLSATESAALTTWLTENGYSLPTGADAVLADYVAKGFAFTAIRVAELPEDRSAVSLNPLALTFPAEEPVFPLRISSLSAAQDADTEVLLFVMAEQRMETAPYPTVQLDTSSLGYELEPLEAYAQRLVTQSQGADGPAFVLESAMPVPLAEVGLGDLVDPAAQPSVSAALVPEAPGGALARLTGVLPELMVSRLHSFMRPEEMTGDVLFAASSTTDEFQPVLYTRASLAEDGARPAPLACASLIGVPGLAAGCVRRGPGRRRLAVSAVAAVLAAIVVL